MNLQTTSTLLELVGHEVVGIQDGVDAKVFLDSSKIKDIDVGLFDLVLNGSLNGVDLIRIAKQNRPNLPVIIQTALEVDKSSSEIVSESEGNNSKMRGFLKKPFDPEELIALLKQIESEEKDKGT